MEISPPSKKGTIKHSKDKHSKLDSTLNFKPNPTANGRPKKNRDNRKIKNFGKPFKCLIKPAVI